MGGAVKTLEKIRAMYGPTPDSLEQLMKAMKAHMRRLGVLTSEAAERIDGMGGGVVETGQQPVCLGGPSLILNKIAYISSLSGIAEGIVPLFYVADYDGVQPELLNSRVPSESPRGLLLSYPSGLEYEGSPIYELPVPSEEWLRKTLERVEGNYKGLLRDVEVDVRDEKLEKLAHVFTIIRSAYYSTENVSDLSTKIVGTLVNLEANLGVPILQFSTPGTRCLFQPGYELLLAEPGRSLFIEASNEACRAVEEAGYRSQIGSRSQEYVPFYLECQNPGCHRTRIELNYVRVAESTTASVKGKCPKCGEVYEYSFDASNPDLSEVIDWIAPRVDSRQVVVDSAMPVLAHIGGPGETSYYAEVIPAARALGLPFPTFLRYSRTFYGTPWNEARAKAVHELGHRTLVNDSLFKALGDWVVARNSSDSDSTRRAHDEIREAIESTRDSLVGVVTSLESEIDAIKGRLRDPAERVRLLQEMREKQASLRDLETYLSSAFGRYAPEHTSQEVSWCWIDLATVSGVGDLMGVYNRIYSELTPNSSMFYVNL
ncbi:MAG TPA: bacillithiol biosynthesis BshC [Patescibacteria group bacterium]|nr:bacillithiol biosynthesis BshC [Patescibacteria group bacterium]